MSEPDGDPEAAEEIAREYISRDLKHPSDIGRGSLSQLAEVLASMSRKLEEGEYPEKNDIEEARFYLQDVNDRLDQLTALMGLTRWDTGVPWGELTEEEQTEIEEERGGPTRRGLTDDS